RVRARARDIHRPAAALAEDPVGRETADATDGDGGEREQRKRAAGDAPDEGFRGRRSHARWPYSTTVASVKATIREWRVPARPLPCGARLSPPTSPATHAPRPPPP